MNNFFKNNILKVSLIIATYNDYDHLLKVIECIQNQDYLNIELIIVDGGSKDRTVSYLRELSSQLSNLKWISEKDNGIYDALNKGIKMATGDIIGCCYDYFANNHVLSDIVKTFNNYDVQAIHGDLNYIDASGRIIRKWRMGKGTIQQGWMAAHPTLYVKKSVYETYGFYKTDYKISADYEFMVRIFGHNSITITYIPEILINMEHGGTSTNSLSSYIEGVKEAYHALKENKIKHPIFITIKRFFKVIFQFF